tara:strand:+ start:1364 stop:1651 length:288 start_codon:yes stop_codon:yes gene_type:complete
MTFLISLMSFANFVFYPLVIGTIVAVIIEQIIRRLATSEPRSYEDEKMINRAMGIRKYLYRQAWIFNIIWFVCYGILLFVLRPGAQQMPDMIWQG